VRRRRLRGLPIALVLTVGMALFLIVVALAVPSRQILPDSMLLATKSQVTRRSLMVILEQQESYVFRKDPSKICRWFESNWREIQFEGFESSRRWFGSPDCQWIALVDMEARTVQCNFSRNDEVARLLHRFGLF
jgi:hypothetical protein